MRDRQTPRGAVLSSEAATVSKTEALRQAISALGYRAPVTEILAYVRDHFGIGEPAPVAQVTPGPLPAPPPEAVREEIRRPAPKRGKSNDRTNPAE